MDHDWIIFVLFATIPVWFMDSHSGAEFQSNLQRQATFEWQDCWLTGWLDEEGALCIRLNYPSITRPIIGAFVFVCLFSEPGERPPLHHLININWCAGTHVCHFYKRTDRQTYSRYICRPVSNISTDTTMCRRRQRTIIIPSRLRTSG